MLISSSVVSLSEFSILFVFSSLRIVLFLLLLLFAVFITKVAILSSSTTSVSFLSVAVRMSLSLVIVASVLTILGICKKKIGSENGFSKTTLGK